MRQLITVENKSTVLSPQELSDLVWAVNYQVTFQYGRSRWVEAKLAPEAHVVLLRPGVVPPLGAWNLILLDNSDQQGALGYHDDVNGNGIPYSEVFCKDAVADGSTPSGVASHEAIEMLVDPNVATPRKAPRLDTKQFYIVEASDAVQGNDYDVGAPEGRSTGTLVADFCLPAWWQLDDAEHNQGGPFSFRASVKGPWLIAPQGYMSVAPADQPDQWSQIYGAQQDRRPNWASRLPRIHPE